jgi:hypothetical protein
MPALAGGRLLLLAIAALALWLRAWFDGSTVPGRVFLRHDEQHYVDLARELLNGRFLTDYFINPSLFGWMVAAVTAAVGAVRALLGLDASFDLFVARETWSPVVIVLAGRSLSIAASVLSVVVVARLGARIGWPRAGLLAALALAVDGVSIGRAPLCGNESMTTLLALLAVTALVRPGLDAAPMRSRFSAGALLGVATACKYSAGVFGLVAVVALRRRCLPALLGAAVGFALGAPATWFNPAGFVEGFTTQAGFLHDGYRAEDAEKGELGWSFYATGFGAAHQGRLFAAVVAFGLLDSLRRLLTRGAPDRRAHALLLSASLPLYLFLGSGIFHRDRFLLPATPFLLLHGAKVLADLLAARVAALRSPSPVTAPVRTRIARFGGVALLVLVTADALISGVARQGRERVLLGAPDRGSELHRALAPVLRPDETVHEFSLRQADELLLRNDPWREAGVARPPDAIVAAAREQLARSNLQPTCDALRPALVAARDLDALTARLRADGATAIVAIIPARALVAPGSLAGANRDPPFRDITWWPEFAAWLESLPRRAEAATADGGLIAAVLELPR